MIYISAHPHDKGQRVIRRQVTGRANGTGKAVRVGLRAACSIRRVCRIPIPPTIADVVFGIAVSPVWGGADIMRMAWHLLHAECSRADSAGNTHTDHKNQGNNHDLHISSPA